MLGWMQKLQKHADCARKVYVRMSDQQVKRELIDRLLDSDSLPDDLTLERARDLMD